MKASGAAGRKSSTNSSKKKPAPSPAKRLALSKSKVVISSGSSGSGSDSDDDEFIVEPKKKAAAAPAPRSAAKSDDGAIAPKAKGIPGRTRLQSIKTHTLSTVVREKVREKSSSNHVAVDGDGEAESDTTSSSDGDGASSEFDGSSDDDEDSEDEDADAEDDFDGYCSEEVDAAADPEHATVKQLMKNWANGAMAPSSKGEYAIAYRGLVKWYVLLLLYSFVLQAGRVESQDSAFQTKCGPIKKPYTRFLCLKWMDYQSRRTINWKGGMENKTRLVAGNAIIYFSSTSQSPQSPQSPKSPQSPQSPQSP